MEEETISHGHIEASPEMVDAVIASDTIKAGFTPEPIDKDTDIVIGNEPELPVADETAEKEDSSIGFEDLGLDETTLAAVRKKGFVTPSPIQVLAIPRLLNGDANLIAKARTGTGKTAAFGLPIVQRIRRDYGDVKALILEPTRELAMQTQKEMQSFATSQYPRSCVLYGGAPYNEQIRFLRGGVEIVVGTPGRVQDHLERGTLDISKIDYFILDEADEMLDMGFIEDIENIFRQANPDSRILLFSATMPREILRIAGEFMGDYEIVEEEAKEEEPLHIEQKYWVVRPSEKIEALVRLIDISPDFYGLVFTQTKFDADNVTRQLDERGYQAAALHGDIAQNQREKVLARFRNGKTRVLVATDVAARGIDISGLSHVVNYDLPFDGPTYTHRIGRTGRAGATGCAITFVGPSERRRLEYLKKAAHKFGNSEMEEGEIPSIDEVLDVKRSRMFTDMKRNLGLLPAGAAEAEPASFSDEESVALPDALIAKSTVAGAAHLIQTSAVFERMAEELCSGQNAEAVLAAVLATTYGKSLDRSHYGEITSMRQRGERRAERGGRDSGGNSDQIRLYVQLGRRDGCRAREIADFFHDLLGIPGRMVDRIDVSENFSLASLPKADAERALELMRSDRSIPHMHIDSKSGGDRENFRRERSSGFRGASRERNFGGFSERRGGFDGEGRFSVARGGDRRHSRRDSGGGFGRGSFRRDFDGRRDRSSFRAPTERNSRAGIYRKDNSPDNY